MNTLKDNSIGIASHSSRGISIQENSFTDTQMAGITSVSTLYSRFVGKKVNESQNGIFLDAQSSDNIVDQNQVQNNEIYINNANGLPISINKNRRISNVWYYHEILLLNIVISVVLINSKTRFKCLFH
jgi:nitrous oxidase accessory protein NosD